jgi:hypothetical protein
VRELGGYRMTTRMSELNDGQGADVDTHLVPLVKFLNKMGVKTVSSRPGSEFSPAVVRMVGDDYLSLVDVLFRQVQPMLTQIEGASVEINYSDGVWIGRLHVPVKHLDDLTSRVGCWLEMLHK